MFGFKKKKLELAMPVDGKIISLAEVPDEVFSTGMMGQGFAIEPSSDEIYAPVAGTITNVFPTKHAISLKTKQGLELLLHLGLDTVELAGKPFEMFVSANQEVTPDTLLCKMDRNQVIEAKKSTVVLVLVTSGEDVTVTDVDSSLHGMTCGSVKIGWYSVLRIEK